MRCVNCGQPVVGDIAICPQCARLVIAKEEEDARFLELIRKETQATSPCEAEPLQSVEESDSSLQPTTIADSTGLPISESDSATSNEKNMTALDLFALVCYFTLALLVFYAVLSLIMQI